MVDDHLTRLVNRNAELRAFVVRLLQPDEFGYSVTPEVRAAARRVLNLPEAPATVRSQEGTSHDPDSQSA